MTKRPAIPERLAKFYIRCRSFLLHRILGIPHLAPTPFPVTIYGKRIHWETPVQLAIKDFLRKCDCAIDVGANIGGLSVAMSRIVGRRGKVVAFEANPHLESWLRNDLKANRARNVVVATKAVSIRSGEKVKFYCDDSLFGVSSGFEKRGETWTEVEVETVSLDDYCREHELTPKVIKIDVEGAEILVLRGAERLLTEGGPVVALEYQAKHGANDPLVFLAEHGYRLFDVSLCREIDKDFYFREYPGHPVVNVLAIPAERVPGSKYERIGLRRVADYRAAPGSTAISGIRLPRRGRYLIRADLEGNEFSVGILQVRLGDEELYYVEADVGHLMQHTSANVLFEVYRRCRVDFVLLSKRGEPPVLKGVEVFLVGA